MIARLRNLLRLVASRVARTPREARDSAVPVSAPVCSPPEQTGDAGTYPHATEAWLHARCLCGAMTLHGSALDVSRVCTSCLRVVTSKGDRCAVVPVTGWQAFQKYGRWSPIGGDA